MSKNRKRLSKLLIPMLLLSGINVNAMETRPGTPVEDEEMKMPVEGEKMKMFVNCLTRVSARDYFEKTQYGLTVKQKMTNWVKLWECLNKLIDNWPKDDNSTLFNYDNIIVTSKENWEPIGVKFDSSVELSEEMKAKEAKCRADLLIKENKKPGSINSFRLTQFADRNFLDYLRPYYIDREDFYEDVRELDGPFFPDYLTEDLGLLYSCISHLLYGDDDDCKQALTFTNRKTLLADLKNILKYNVLSSPTKTYVIPNP